MKSLKVSVFDNGKTIDRYTVVVEVGQLADFYGMSSNPNSSNGFNQYCGSNAEGYKKGAHLGKNVGWDGAPEEVKAAILERLKGY